MRLKIEITRRLFRDAGKNRSGDEPAIVQFRRGSCARRRARRDRQTPDDRPADNRRTKRHTFRVRSRPSGSTFCAVPVLPAMMKPGTAAAAAVPRSLTTPRSASPICLAVWGEITWRTTIGESELITLAIIARDRFHDPRRHEFAAVRDRRHRHRHLQRRNADFVAHRNARDRNLAPDCGGRTIPLISPGSSMPVRSPNPKRRMYS